MSSKELVSVGGNWTSHRSALSADGRFVVFDSRASNLVPRDSNTWSDVFVRDRQAGTVERVSLTSTGAQMAPGSSSVIPSLGICADGSRVVFVTDSANLVPDDLNDRDDVFVRDRAAGTTVCASLTPKGVPGNFGAGYASISAAGRYVAFYSSSTDLTEDASAGVFVRDLQENVTRFVDTGGPPHMSPGGRFVSYVQFDGGVGTGRIFVYDVRDGSKEPVSLGYDGSPANGHSFTNSISHNGRWVAFDSVATNLVQGDAQDSSWGVYLRDLQAGTTTRVAQFGGSPRISSDGRYVAYSSQTGIYVYDCATQATESVVSCKPGELIGAPGGFSADGALLSFSTDQSFDPVDANDFSDVYVWIK